MTPHPFSCDISHYCTATRDEVALQTEKTSKLTNVNSSANTSHSPTMYPHDSSDSAEETVEITSNDPVRSGMMMNSTSNLGRNNGTYRYGAGQTFIEYKTFSQCLALSRKSSPEKRTLNNVIKRASISSIGSKSSPEEREKSVWHHSSGGDESESLPASATMTGSKPIKISYVTSRSRLGPPSKFKIGPCPIIV
jgi:hypothetical protein